MLPDVSLLWQLGYICCSKSSDGHEILCISIVRPRKINLYNGCGNSQTQGHRKWRQSRTESHSLPKPRSRRHNKSFPRQVNITYSFLIQTNRRQSRVWDSRRPDDYTDTFSLLPTDTTHRRMLCGRRGHGEDSPRSIKA